MFPFFNRQFLRLAEFYVAHALVIYKYLKFIPASPPQRIVKTQIQHDQSSHQSFLKYLREPRVPRKQLDFSCLAHQALRFNYNTSPEIFHRPFKIFQQIQPVLLMKEVVRKARPKVFVYKQNIGKRLYQQGRENITSFCRSPKYRYINKTNVT